MAVDVRRLEGLSLHQLNELLEDEEQLQNMALEMEETQNVQLSKDMTLASNRSLAEGNLLYQPKLDDLKATLIQKYQGLQVLFESYQIKKTKLDRQSSNASLETLLALLQAEGAKIEEDTEDHGTICYFRNSDLNAAKTADFTLQGPYESEMVQNMAEKFLDGEIPLDSFVDEYQNQRKLAHLRRVKIEKLQEMVLKGPRLPVGPPQPRAPETTTPALQTSEANAPPSVMPRRNPPPPPPAASAVPVGRFPTPFTAAARNAVPAFPYPGVSYPPLPPRTGMPTPSPTPQFGYPTPFAQQYPPALPQRPPPSRLPPNPGFILQ